MPVTLKQGDKLPITLEFEKAGKVQVSLDVEAWARRGRLPLPVLAARRV
jgi:copper(I)-binding protein